MKILIGAALLLGLGIAAFIVMGVQSRAGTVPDLVDGALAPCPESPNCVSSYAVSEDPHYVEPLKIGGLDKDDVGASLSDALESMGGEVLNRDAEYLGAEFTSPLFGFVDDVQCIIDAENNVVHVRSASRVGHSDLGVNRQRVETLRERIAK